MGGPNLLIERGSSLELECMIRHVVSPPQFVMWEHGGQVVPGETVNIQERHEIVTKSILTIDKVIEESAGKYSCMPDNITPAHINIQIVNHTEEQMAVINNANITTNIHHLFYLTIFFGAYAIII